MFRNKIYLGNPAVSRYEMGSYNVFQEVASTIGTTLYVRGKEPGFTELAKTLITSGKFNAEYDPEIECIVMHTRGTSESFVQELRQTLETAIRKIEKI